MRPFQRFKTDSKGSLAQRLASLPALLLIWGLALYFPLQWIPWELCTLKRLTSIPCPGCGLTRSLIHLAHLRFIDAFELNPLASVFICLAVLAYTVWFFQPLCVRHTQKNGRIKNFFARFEKGNPLAFFWCRRAGHRIFMGIFLSALLANWLYILIRNYSYGIPY